MSAQELPVVLFLDFDGVLHHFFPIADDTDDGNKHFAFVCNFEKAVRSCERDVEIVISSTWRKSHTLDEIKQKFSADIADKIVGVTPVVGPGNQRGSRQIEVEAWMKDNRPHSPWVEIDDVPDLYDNNAVVVSCADQFCEREHEYLVEAVRDPVVYTEKQQYGRTPFKI